MTMEIDITASGKKARSMASGRTSGLMATVIRDNGLAGQEKWKLANTLGQTVTSMWVNFMKETIMVKGPSLTYLEKP